MDLRNKNRGNGIPGVSSPPCNSVTDFSWNYIDSSASTVHFSNTELPNNWKFPAAVSGVCVYLSGVWYVVRVCVRI